MAFPQERQDLPNAAPALKAMPTGGPPLHAINENGVESDQNPIFDQLVSSEGEVAGLVAYSLYKQNKRAWLNDFLKATGRPPSEAETRSYIIGESTERRLSIYRHLAQATLSGEGPETPGVKLQPRMSNQMSLLLWTVVILTAVGVIALAVHSGALTMAK